MLSKQQKVWFIKAINKLLKLDVSKDSLLQLDSMEYDNDKNQIRAYIKSEDTGDRVDWYFLYNKNNRIYIIKSGVYPFQVATVTSDGNVVISDSGKAYLKSVTNSDINNTMYNVIAQIIYMSITVDNMSRIGVNDLRASYNSTYPSVLDCSDGDINNIAVKIGDEIVPWPKAKTIDGILAPLKSLDDYNCDILCKHDNTYVPLFKIWLRGDNLSFARYTLPQKKDNRPKLSNTVDTVKISEDDNILPEIKEIIANYKKLDDIEKPSSFGNVRSIVMSWNDLLERNNIKPIRKPDEIEKYKNMSYAWAIDAMPTVYTADGMKVNVQVDRSHLNSYSVCIKYFATGFGNIINLHIKPDPKLIVDPTNLDKTVAFMNGNAVDDNDISDENANKVTQSHVNLFRVEAASSVVVEYNNGQGGMTSIDYPMDSAFDLINTLIPLYNGIFDVIKLVEYNTDTVYGSSKTLFDSFSATANYKVHVDNKTSTPNAFVFIHSTTNNNVLRVEVTLPLDSKDLVYKFPIGSKWQAFKFNKNTPSLFDQCVAYDNDESRKTTDSSGHIALGAYISDLIQKTFTNNEMSNRKGDIINTGDNQQTKVNNAIRLQFDSKLSDMLLNVRDAFLNTFGPFIGTHQNPGIGSAHYDIDENYSNTSKKETVEIDGKKVDKWIPVLTSFTVAGGTGGSFDAMYNTKGEPEVFCSFDQKYKKVSIRQINGNYELSDDFLKWYLITCANCNALVGPILRIVDRGNASEMGISQRIVDIVDDAWGDHSNDTEYDEVDGDQDPNTIGNTLQDYKDYQADLDEHNREMDDMYGTF